LVFPSNLNIVASRGGQRRAQNRVAAGVRRLKAGLALRYLSAISNALRALYSLPVMEKRFGQCSERIAQVQAPIIPIVAGLIREHPGTISLGQGVVGYPPPPQCLERIKDFAANTDNNKYKPVQGVPELVQALGEKLRNENGIHAEPRQIFVTSGGNLAFMNAILAITNPGDEVILQTPYYFNHEMAVTMISAKPVLVPTDGNYQLQPARIEAAITPRTKAVVTISPNNPTGAVYREEALREVNQICREHGVYHMHDEAYEYFTYGSAKHFSPASIEGAENHTISLFSLSKAYGFASWRIGYMVVPHHLIEAVNKIQDTILICAPVISQFAALGALQAGKAYCAEQLWHIGQVRTIVQNELATIQDICEVPAADGAFYFLLRLHTAEPAMQIVENLVKRFGVAVIPGNAFGIESGSYLRIAYAALNPSTAAEGIGRLVKGLRNLIE
jgi:aspartate/methionine/tyrosine aminotransferase